jgi:hypothetical protein
VNFRRLVGDERHVAAQQRTKKIGWADVENRANALTKQASSGIVATNQLVWRQNNIANKFAAPD